VNDLSENIVVVIGGTSGIGLETARQAHAAGAKLILTGRDQGRLDAARDELGASTATLDLADADGLRRFFGELPAQVDHVLVSGSGPAYARRRVRRHSAVVVVGPADVAALALHLMTNTALTGATYDVDGGQQLVS
jgi:NAD(P)-dependent dehydrogenase (short-subunit alcohol dehydrogenase family)